ncbi:pyridoxamine 5'-phosphate oxidase family protein [Sphingobacterium hungaricum]
MSKENVSNEEGIEKLKKLAEGIDVCMLCTGLDEQPIEVTPMSVQEVDDSGHIWFLASKESDKYVNIKRTNSVQLLFADNSNYHYLSVYGEANFSEDQERIDQYWNKMIEAWFEKGREDPNIVLIRVKPFDCYYWDTKSNKMISILKMAYSAISGSKMDEGREGKIEI